MTIDAEPLVDARLAARLEALSAQALDTAEIRALERDLAARPDGERLLEMFAPLTELESRRVRKTVRPRAGRRSRAPILAPVAIAAGIVAAIAAGLFLSPEAPVRLALEADGAAAYDARDEVRVRLQPSGPFEELAYFTVDDTRAPRQIRWVDLERGQLEVRQRAFGLAGERYGRSEVMFVGGRRGCVGAWSKSQPVGDDCAVATFTVDVLPPRMAVTVAELGEAMMGDREADVARRVVVTPTAQLSVRALAFDPELSRRGYDGLDVVLEYRSRDAWISAGAPNANGAWTLDGRRLFEGDLCVVPLRIVVRATASETIDLELYSRNCNAKGDP
ncbi:MAG: hypothetical protein RIT81_30170 [Deltaproteobacteria bacterium]